MGHVNKKKLIKDIVTHKKSIISFIMESSDKLRTFSESLKTMDNKIDDLCERIMYVSMLQILKGNKILETLTEDLNNYKNIFNLENYQEILKELYGKEYIMK